MPAQKSLAEWLAYLESIHPTTIELGLERVLEVYQRLNIDFSSSQVIIVGGTNGKGSTCAMVEQGCLLAGKTVGVYSSPHLMEYTERVRVNGQSLNEQQHVDAFAQVEAVRAATSLTYFEFGTLAALCLLAQQGLDVVLLEVGLGGRLDAVNIVEPDLSVITSIDLDHQDWLGDTREKIAFEKAGILRQGGPAIISEPQPPKSLLQQIADKQVQALFQGQDFALTPQPSNSQLLQWRGKQQFSQLPSTQLHPANAATALAVLEWLQFELSASQVAQLLENTRLSGRFQSLRQKPNLVIDVAHNPQSTGWLAEQIQQQHYAKLHLVVGMLADKDIAASLAPLLSLTDNWYCASLTVPRGAKASQLHAVIGNGECFDLVGTAIEQALFNAGEEDLIVVFGSFYTVSAALTMHNNVD